jgi:hypothetical protein
MPRLEDLSCLSKLRAIRLSTESTWLCKAVLDRLTDQAHIIETGAESYRFRRTLGKKRKV